MNKRQRKKLAKFNQKMTNAVIKAEVDTLTWEKLKATMEMFKPKVGKENFIHLIGNPVSDNKLFYQQYVKGSWDVSKEGDKTGFICHKTDSFHFENVCPICEQEEKMTLQELVNKINRFRRELNQGLDDIWIYSRPSSSGGGTTMEIRCGATINGKLLAKSTNGGALNWFLKGMLTSFQNDAAPTISGFNQQLAAITRSNYSRVVED